MTKTRRNDPCPCGSGKKYKHCCLLHGQADNGVCRYDALRAVENRLIGNLYRHGEGVLGKGGRAAWDEWTLWSKAPLPESNGDLNEFVMFLPWSLFCWRPVALRSKGDTIAGSYLAANDSRLTNDERSILQAMNGLTLSFWDVLNVRPGSGYRLRNIFHGAEVEATERSASKFIKANDILFCSAAEICGIGSTFGMAPFAIPPIQKGEIIEFRERLKKKYGDTLTNDHLSTEQEALRELFFAIRERLFNPPMPQACNTDGDTLVPHKIKYKVDDSNDAFHALKSLQTKVRTEKDGMDEAETDPDGRVTKATLRWLKGPVDCTVLAVLHIDGKNLTVDVNSGNRCRKIKTEIERLLPSAKHVATVVEPIDRHLEKAWQERGQKRETGPKLPSPEELPEDLAAMKKMMDDHWRKWPDIKLPALGGRTPRQALCTSDGREMVEALLADFERRNENLRPFQRVDLEGLRQTLVLPVKAN